MPSIFSRKTAKLIASSRRPSCASDSSYPVNSITSDKLSDRQVREAIAAADFALSTTPLNRFVTINWERAGIADAAVATRAFVKYASDFCRSQGSPFAHLWTLETTGGTGVHAHILMHVEHRLGKRFGQLQRGWCRNIGARMAKRDILTKHVGGATTAYLRRHCDGGSFDTNHRLTAAYILKHCSIEIARELNFPHLTRSCKIRGQRYGCSRSLARKARRAATSLGA